MVWYWSPGSLWVRMMPRSLKTDADSPLALMVRTASSTSSTRNSVTRTPAICPRIQMGEALNIRGDLVTVPMIQSELAMRPVMASWK